MKCKKLFALALAMVMCVPMSFNALVKTVPHKHLQQHLLRHF